MVLEPGTAAEVVQYIRNGEYLMVGGGQQVKFWKVADGSEDGAAIEPDSMYTAVVSPDETLVATTGYGEVKLWDRESRALLRTFGSEHSTWVVDVEFSPDGTELLTGGGQDYKAKVFEVSTGNEIWSQNLGGKGDTVGWSFDGTRILVGSFTSGGQGKAWIYSRSTGNVEVTVEDIKPIRASWKPDGTQFVTASSKNVKLWDANTGDLVRSYDYPSEMVEPNSAIFSPDGDFLLILGWPSKAALLNADSGDLVESFSLPDTTEVPRGAFRFGSPPTRRRRLDNAPHGIPVTTTTTRRRLSSVPNNILTVGGDDAKLWTFDGSTLLRTFNHGAGLYMASFSPDGRYICTASSSGGGAKIFEHYTGAELHHIKDGTTMESCVFSPDSNYILLPSRPGSAATIHKVATGELVREITYSPLQAGENTVHSASWSPDMSRIVISCGATVSATLTGARIFDAETPYALLATMQHSTDNTMTARYWSRGNGLLITHTESPQIFTHFSHMSCTSCITSTFVYTCSHLHDLSCTKICSTMDGK